MRTFKTTAAGLLLAGSVLHAGCSNSADSSIIFGKAAPSTGPVATASIASPTERPARVASISACAQAYGYAHDAAQLRGAYLSYETKRGATSEQLAQIARDYDGAFCGDRRSWEL